MSTNNLRLRTGSSSSSLRCQPAARFAGCRPAGDGLEALYEGRTARRVAAEHMAKLRDILAALDLSRREGMDLPGFRLHATEGLGVTRQALSELLNEPTGVSVEMALRLSKAFGSTPEVWLGMQTAYDLWQTPATAPGRSRSSA